MARTGCCPASAVWKPFRFTGLRPSVRLADTDWINDIERAAYGLNNHQTPERRP